MDDLILPAQLAPHAANPAAAPAVGAAVDVASEWAAVASVVAPADAPTAAPAMVAGHVPADLAVAMHSFAARRDLRRILIAFGAIGKPRTDGQPGRPARPEDVVGAFITASPGIVEELLRTAGAISDEDRIQRFTASIEEAGRACDPRDPVAVEQWIQDVASILRDEHTA